MTTLLSPLPLLLPLLLVPLLSLLSLSEARDFDVWPHPRYWGDNYDCSKLKDKYKGRACSHFANDTEIIPGYHHAASKVCAEWRLWFPSHCVFESKKCSLHTENWKHMGMCNHPASHQIWKTGFSILYEQHQGGCKNQWCEKEDDDMLCTVYQYEFESMCNLEYEWCETLKAKGYYEIFNVKFLKDWETCDMYQAGKSMFNLESAYMTNLLKEKELGIYRNAHKQKSPVLDYNEITRILTTHPKKPPTPTHYLGHLQDQHNYPYAKKKDL